jgi:hypothetical protein
MFLGRDAVRGVPGAEGEEMRAHQHGSRRLAGLVLGLGLLAALTAAPVAVAREANGHASCMGIERSAISPPGSSDEVPGGSSAINAEIKEIAATLGLPPGALFGFIASLHEGSHAACDEALE